MRNYFNFGLLYREFRNIRAVILLNFIAMIGLFVFPFMNKIEYLKDILVSEEFKFQWCKDGARSTFQHFFSNSQGAFDKQLFIIIIMILIGTFIISKDLIGRKNEVLSSMPYKREEIITTKYIMAIFVVVIPAIITFIIIHLMYLGNKDILSVYITNRMILTWSTLNILVYIFVVTFIMLIQTLSGISIVGGVVGGILLVFPMGIAELINQNLLVFDYKLNTTILTFKNLRIISNFMNEISRSISPISYNFDLILEKSELIKKTKDLNHLRKLLGFDRMEIYISVKFRIIILILCTIVAFVLMVYAFKKISFEKIGYVIMFKPLERIFKIGTVVSFGLLGGSICERNMISSYELWRADLCKGINQYIIKSKLDVNEYMRIINKITISTLLVIILCGCITYLIVNKIIKMNKR